jgi:hypothetical protein
MPYADPERMKEYQRQYKRKQRAGEVIPGKKFYNPEPATAKELLSILTAALNEIIALETDPIIKGRAVAYLVGVGFRGVEISDLEERLQILEEEINGHKVKN